VVTPSLRHDASPSRRRPASRRPTNPSRRGSRGRRRQSAS
jgi:hypothetical protein